MEISEQLRCLFSAKIERRDDTHMIEIPNQEIEFGNLKSGDTYRVAMLHSPSCTEIITTDTSQEREQPIPPVEEGETRRIEIEDIGDQGDGIARIDRGFVIIVPDTEQGERVNIEITDVRETVAFAVVTERLSYYD